MSKDEIRNYKIMMDIIDRIENKIVYPLDIVNNI